jgi:RNase H-fold protein (predicted Holliday junction resolvase)
MPERAQRTVLAFDFGLHHIGVAVGEPGPGTAHPLPGIHARLAEARFAQIGKLLAEWQPAALVVGLPLAEDGARSRAAPSASRASSKDVSACRWRASTSATARPRPRAACAWRPAGA